MKTKYITEQELKEIANRAKWAIGAVKDVSVETEWYKGIVSFFRNDAKILVRSHPNFREYIYTEKDVLIFHDEDLEIFMSKLGNLV